MSELVILVSTKWRVKHTGCSSLWRRHRFNSLPVCPALVIISWDLVVSRCPSQSDDPFTYLPSLLLMLNYYESLHSCFVICPNPKPGSFAYYVAPAMQLDLGEHNVILIASNSWQLMCSTMIPYVTTEFSYSSFIPDNYFILTSYINYFST